MSKKTVKITDEQAAVIGETLAEIFAMKRDKEHKDRFVMGGGYFTKTPLGVFRVFMDLAGKIQKGEKVKP